MGGSDDAPYQARVKSDQEDQRPQPTRRSRRATAGKRKSWAEDDLPGRDSYDDGTFSLLTTAATWSSHCSVSFCSCCAFGSGDDLHFDCGRRLGRRLHSGSPAEPEAGGGSAPEAPGCQAFLFRRKCQARRRRFPSQVSQPLCNCTAALRKLLQQS